MSSLAIDSEATSSRNRGRPRSRDGLATHENPVASLDAFTNAVADARRALRELQDETSTLELITSQLHRHALLLKLIRDALALNLDIPAQSASQTRDSIQRQASVNAFCQDIHTLASVSAFKPSSNSDTQENLHCLICLEDYIEDCPVVVLPCHQSHNFHINCLANWARHCKQLTCPLCRSPFETQGPQTRPS
ncbi:hypothetical protein PSTG_00686 [Puccinia striiformis f. sp. tritici PST-78]|uniref:RING-type E3 ubiquitin transferase n=1 Tax=Puccinia striiformis f. sp. tritici PST-78 TaxID=1165861 RepID=A0A0L0W3X3_9BASI|nr:hypothetical protein PSTG_00686 [Puccinia striiformis f. sp. tritici PST-78]